MRGRGRRPQMVVTMLRVLLLLSIAWALPPAMPASFGLAQPNQLVSDARPTPTPILPPPGQALPYPESPEYPDLIIEQIEVVPAIPLKGQTVTIRVTIRNQSAYDVLPGNNFWTDLYVDVDPAVVPPVPYQIGVHDWPCQSFWVPAGGSHVLDTDYVFDDAKTYTLYAQVDTFSHVQESEENNNVMGPILVQVWSPLITAVYYDTYLTNEPEEAFRLMNVGTGAGAVTDWTITDGPTESTITLSDTLAAGAPVWIAREADDFTLEFGFPPDYEYGDDTDPAVPNLTTTGTFALANTGDEVVLKDDGAVIVDSVVYEAGDPEGTGWSGPAIYPYGGDTVGMERFAREEQGIEAFGKEGQVLYRKLDQATGLPVPDTDTAADWAQATAIEDNGLDAINGRKVQYPGWDLERVVPLCSACPRSLVQKVSEG